MKYHEPSAYELAQYRDQTGLGINEARKQIIRNRVIDSLKRESVSTNDLRNVLVLMLEGKV